MFREEGERGKNGFNPINRKIILNREGAMLLRISWKR